MNTSNFTLAGKYACILKDKTFKVTVCRPENEELLRDIIQLLIPERRISSLTLGREENSGLSVSEKTVIFDCICTDAESNTTFVVELQCAEMFSYRDRMLCYATYPIRDQLASKLASRKTYKDIDRMDYSLNPTYVVSIVDFALEHVSAEGLDDNGLISRYAIRNDGNGELMTDALHFVYLELGRLPYGRDESDKCTSLLEQFAYSVKYIHELTALPKGFEDPMLERLYRSTELALMSPEQRRKYDKEMRTWLDEVAEKRFAREKGLAEGRAEGRTEGLAEGDRAAREEIAANLLASGIDAVTVAKATRLSVDDVEALTAEMPRQNE